MCHHMGEALSWEELAERHRADAEDERPETRDEPAEAVGDTLPSETAASEEPPAEPRAPADD